MGQIGIFVPGEVAEVRDVYWNWDGKTLFYTAEITNRRGGHKDCDDLVCDYGSDVGLDPAIKIGDCVKYVHVGPYSGIWIREGDELYTQSVHQSHDRVVRNRRFAFHCNIGISGHTAIDDWLKELATQTRTRVLHGSQVYEPGEISQLRSFSPELLNWLQHDVDRLKELDDDSFERLLMDIFNQQGYVVRQVTQTRRKDGGVDIVVWPEGSLTYLIAIQAKHHRVESPTGVSYVRDFCGTLKGNLVFGFGLLVTNTRFTGDARHFAEKTNPGLRLRDGGDVCRWLSGDFSRESEWKELPDEIDLAPGVTVPLSAGPPRLTDMEAEVKRASSVLDLYLPKGPDFTSSPFGR